MRPQKILDTDMITGLTKVFRDKGYEGASLKELADVTGLKKASLYHRFPNGKQEMAQSVFNEIDDWVKNRIFFSLRDESESPKLRIKKALNNIRLLYGGGKETCIFRAFSMDSGMSLFEEQIKNGMNEWITSFTEIGIALHLTAGRAKEIAIQTLVEIQGSLVVAKGLRNTDIFETTLERIENRYLNQ